MSEPNKPSTSAAELFGSDRMWGLKELALPEPVSWWPQTIGWAALGIIILGLIVWVGWRFWQKYQYNRYRREGLQRLRYFALHPSDIIELPQLLRVSALNAAPRIEVASLRGRYWINWLNSSAGAKLFDDEDAKLLDDLAFARFVPSSIDNDTRQHLIEASKVWMRSHHASV